MKQYLRSALLTGASLPWRLAAAAGFYNGTGAPVQFVVEKADWAIRWVGENVSRVINGEDPGLVTTTTQPYRLADRVAHFGSQYMWLTWGHRLSTSNRFVTSYFHGKPEDGDEVKRHIDAFLTSVPRLSAIVVSASIVENRLLDWGVPPHKLTRIPIGVDTRIFLPPDPEQRRAARQLFGIPDDAVVVGSFQKDGIGWGDGMEPKLIKGPDVLLQVAAALRREVPLWVLLTGPARGFVKKGLTELGIPFSHTYAQSHRELATCYHALDLYTVTSREEGGPMGLMEAMASGVPVISSKVGMAPDLITSGITGELVDIGDIAAFTAAALRLLALPGGGAQLRADARQAVMVADWDVVGCSHRDLVYRPLMGGLTH